MKNLASVVTSRSTIKKIALEHIKDSDVNSFAHIVNTCVNIENVSLSIDNTSLNLLKSKLIRPVVIDVKPIKRNNIGENNAFTAGVQGLLTLANNKRKADEM